MQDQKSSDTIGPTGLEGEQFWAQPLMQKSTSLFGFKLLTEGKEGILIDAPAKVHLDKHQTVPLIGFRVGETKKLRVYSFQTTTRLILSHIETGSIRIVKPDVAPPPGHKEPNPSPGRVVKDVEVDLNQFMDQGIKLGRYAVSMICGPEISNQRILTIYPSEKAEGTKELEQQLKDLRSKGGSPLPVLVGKTLGLQHEGVPHGDGPAWKIAALKDPAGDRIRLDYRLEVPPRLVYATDKHQVDENGKRIHANLPITVVGFNENRSLVLQMDLGLPVANPPTGQAGTPVVQGSVSFSLAKLLGNQAPQKTLHIWVIALDRHAHLEIPMGVR